MGIVARQSFKAAIVTYAGVALGVLNNLLIYPYMLSVEQYGEVQFVLQTATFFTPFLMMGLAAVLTRYYPKYKEDPAQKQHFYGLVFAIVSFNVLLFLGLFLVFQEQVTAYYFQKSGVAENSIYVLVAISMLLPFQGLARSYAANQGRIAVPSLFNQLLKLILPLVVLAYYHDFIGFNQVVRSLVIYHLMLTVSFLVYMSRQDRFRPRLSLSVLRKDPLLRPMLIFSFFSVMGGIGATLTNQVDILMITSMKGVYQNGLYVWAMFVANAIAIPFTLIAGISTPLIAAHWNEDDREALSKIYQQSSSSMLVLSTGVFVALWLVIDEVFALMPKGDQYGAAKWVVLILCISKIIDMAAGLNNQIIMMSRSYKMNLLFLGITVVSNIGLNLLLIPKYGIEGSAVATIISISLFNSMKYMFLRRRYGLDPFGPASLYTLLLGAAVFGLVWLLPRSDHSLLNLLLYSGLSGLLFFAGAYLFRLSPALNDFANKQLARLGFKGMD